MIDEFPARVIKYGKSKAFTIPAEISGDYRVWESVHVTLIKRTEEPSKQDSFTANVEKWGSSGQARTILIPARIATRYEAKEIVKVTLKKKEREISDGPEV